MEGLVITNVQVISEQDYPTWEKYLEKDPSASFFHRIGWLNIVQRAYGHKPLYIMATSEGKVSGILPLFLVSSPILLFANLSATT